MSFFVLKLIVEASDKEIKRTLIQPTVYYNYITYGIQYIHLEIISFLVKQNQNPKIQRSHIISNWDEESFRNSHIDT